VEALSARTDIPGRPGPIPRSGWIGTGRAWYDGAMASGTHAQAAAAGRAHAEVLAALAAGILGPDATPEIPGRVLATLDQLASRRDRDQLLAMLRLLATRAGALALTGRPAPVGGLTPGQAEAVVQGWQESRWAVPRRLASALVAATLTACYAWPGPALERIGYPGPLGPAPDVPRRLEPITLDGDEELACDVVVVGSGAGGGTVAAGLAAAGLDVVVLEKGGYHAEADFGHVEHQANRDLYLYGLTLATGDLGCRILAGSTLGGGTVVNYSTSLATPGFVLAEWARVSGVDAFVSGEVQASLEAVSERLGVTTAASRPGARDALLEKGLARLGWHCAPLPRNVDGCPQDAGCGWCGMGCRHGAKRSTLRTYLEDAAGHGTRIVVGADARRVLINDARAVGVEARAGTHRLRVRARAVVAAAGAVETPALLLRSGLTGQVGRHLRLHPGTAAFGLFDEEVRFWEGTLQARYSAHLRDTLGEYAPILETVPVHPGTGSAAVPWASAADYRALMDRFGNLSLCATLTRDTSSGRVRVDRAGSPRVHYRLNATDERHLAAGLAACGQVLAAAGATEVISLHPRRHTFHPGRPGAFDAWAQAVRRTGFGGGRLTLWSYHQMGSCRMGTSPATSVVDADHQTHQVKNLYVADSSVFPTASGVNPMLSIMGLAHRAAGRVAAHLGGAA
jgi:choline dehydrogenase-like flavoprotein